MPSPGTRCLRARSFGRWLFDFIHPYMDGNSRMARYLMNLILASGGYPWTVIRVDDRQTYMDSMEKASVENNVRPFATFIANCVKVTLIGGAA